ncbi:MAG TPA: lectin-like protein, partial [Myxococcota bacterium]|nr:lectin-like protein [Myxococcota bacterium]
GAAYLSQVASIRLDGMGNPGNGDRTLTFAAPFSDPATGHVYQLVTSANGVTWDQARALSESQSTSCRQGHLVAVTSEEEEAVVLDNVPPGQRIWLGAYQETASPNYAEPAGGFAWVTGEPFVYTDFPSWEPNDTVPTLEQYLELITTSDPAYWNDRTGTAGSAFLIEYEEQAAPALNPANGHYYRAIKAEDVPSWAEAELRSGAATYDGMQGHLATFTSQEELDFAMQAGLWDAGATLWIGLRQDTGAAGYSEPSGGWTWVTGEPSTFTAWASMEPNDVGSEQYGELWGDAGAWNDSDGAGNGWYLIEFDGEGLPYSTATRNYYEVVPRSFAEWADSRDDASLRRHAGRAGHLMTVTSAEEQAFLLQNLAGGNYNVGGFQAPGSAEPAGGWQWVTGEAFSYTSWSPGEPNDQVGREQVMSVFDNGMWNDNEDPWLYTPGNDGYLIEYDTIAAPSCSDGVRNGGETDVDCGGDTCGQCERGQTCAETADCDATVCVEHVCERAMVITGTTKASGAIVGQYVGQSITRVDFASAPTGTDFNGRPIQFAVSTGSFVTSGISSPFTGSRVLVGGIPLEGTTGHSYYQSIAPSYFGVILGHTSPTTATNSFNVMNAAGLDNRPVEIVIVDTRP